MSMKRRKNGKVIGALITALLGFVLGMVPGIRFSSYLCFGLTALLLMWSALDVWSEKSGIGKLCKRVFLVGCAVIFLLLACFEMMILRYGEEDRTALPVDAIIVLGAGVNGEEPSLTLQTRIDAAAEYIALHPEVPVVLSGGQGSGENISEAECMRRELWTNSEAWNRRYLLEDSSTSTAENFAFSKEILLQNGIDPETAVIGVVTNDFHLYRARLIAERQGLEIIGAGAELPWWWLTANYYVREAFALVKTLIFD